MLIVETMTFSLSVLLGSENCMRRVMPHQLRPRLRIENCLPFQDLSMASLRIDNGQVGEPCRVAYNSTPKRSMFTALHCKRTASASQERPAKKLGFARHEIGSSTGPIG